MRKQWHTHTYTRACTELEVSLGSVVGVQTKTHTQCAHMHMHTHTHTPPTHTHTHTHPPTHTIGVQQPLQHGVHALADELIETPLLACQPFHDGGNLCEDLDLGSVGCVRPCHVGPAPPGFFEGRALRDGTSTTRPSHLGSLSTCLCAARRPPPD